MEISKEDLQILCLRIRGRTIKYIAEIVGLSKAIVFERIKRMKAAEKLLFIWKEA